MTHSTHKTTAAGKAETLTRKAARRHKYAPVPATLHAANGTPFHARTGWGN